RKKLIAALTLARQTQLYLLDEPFEGIDSMTRKRIISNLIAWKPAAATVIISDHHVSDVANVLDEVVIIKDKHVVAQKNAEELREETGMSIEAYYESFYEGSDQQ
ncbi:MAG: ABC transporter ATP-binding protein, partial [Lacticaseibacillus paracasei]